MTEFHSGFPGITKATICILSSNGGINRDTPMPKVLASLDDFLAKQMEVMWLGHIDAYLNGLSLMDLLTVCDGEEEEAKHLLRLAPEGTHEFLNTIFEEVGHEEVQTQK